MLAPFHGLIEFKLAIRVLEARAVRLARATYEYTPSWPYLDAASLRDRVSSPTLKLTLSIKCNSGNGSPRAAPKRHWVPADQLLAPGVLSEPSARELRQQIDWLSRRADRNRRLAAGLPAEPLPEFI